MLRPSSGGRSLASRRAVVESRNARGTVCHSGWSVVEPTLRDSRPTVGVRVEQLTAVTSSVRTSVVDSVSARNNDPGTQNRAPHARLKPNRVSHSLGFFLQPRYDTIRATTPVPRNRPIRSTVICSIFRFSNRVLGCNYPATRTRF